MASTDSTHKEKPVLYQQVNIDAAASLVAGTHVDLSPEQAQRLRYPSLLLILTSFTPPSQAQDRLAHHALHVQYVPALSFPPFTHLLPSQSCTCTSSLPLPLPLPIPPKNRLYGQNYPWPSSRAWHRVRLLSLPSLLSLISSPQGRRSFECNPVQLAWYHLLL